MNYLRVRNWDKWQSKRKDRGNTAPPWMKLYRSLLTDLDFLKLSAAQRGELTTLWLIAAGNNGLIPDNPGDCQLIGRLDKKPNLQHFVNEGFLINDNQASTTGQPLVNQTETISENMVALEKSREEKSREEIHTSKQLKKIPYQAIVDLYHEILPTLPGIHKLTDTRKRHIAQRWREDLTDLDDWRLYFTEVAASDFLMGRTEVRAGHSAWQANLEWLTRPGNFAKVAEQQYNGTPQTRYANG